jgi:hypothetical protein
MKRALLVFLILSITVKCFGQQFSLYNSRTLFDSFENPSQKAFIPDTSRKYAFNFFIPTVSINTTSVGPAQPYIKKFAFEGILTTQGIDLSNKESNKVFLSSNTYLAMFRIFRSVKFHREMGFSWQIKSDTYLDATNETIAIFRNFKSFTPDLASNPFNNTGNSQTYHQFGYTYREDFNKRLGLGVKLSYLSGIAYNHLDIKSSSIDINQTANSYTLRVNGKFNSNFAYNELDEKVAIPGFKNPGLALTASANYKLKDGWYLLGNLKDLGFIKWNKESYTYSFNRAITINNANSTDAYRRLSSELGKFISKDYEKKSFTSLLNGKAEVLLNKNIGVYQPNILLSKSFLYKGADIALINNLTFKSSVFSLSTAYNTNGYTQWGGQYMLKTPNLEFFIGSDNIFKSYYFTKGFITEDSNIGKGYTGASVYLGFSLKYGTPMQRRANATIIPGIGNNGDKAGFFKRILSRKK